MYEYKIYNYDNCPRELFRFRYKVYVEELNRKQTYACHKTRTIEDPLDQTAHHAVVTKQDEIIACVRLNILREGSVHAYHDLYELSRLSAEDLERASICTRNMVAQPYRSTGVSVRMLKLIYEHGMRRDVTTCFMDVNQPLIKLFSKFGYVPLFEKDHPDYGRVTVMRLDVLDIERLTAIRSPFASICRRYLEEQETLAPA